MYRTQRTITVLALTLAALLALGGCSAEETTPSVDLERAEPLPVRIGTLPTEDALPLWVAEERGLFAQFGLPKVEIVTFQAAQERDAAMTAGAIDAFMGDIIAAAQLEAGGVPVTIATVMLGSTADEGRFGIVAAPGSGFNDVAALADVPIGTSSATIQEYVVDGLMEQAGIPEERVKKEEVKKVPVRFDLVMNGQLKAAALPEPLLSLAVLQGAELLADDTVGENLSQTVLVFSDEFLAERGGIESMDAVLSAWDEGAGIVNAGPDAFRDMLVDKARLPEPLRDTYAINTYPTRQVPSAGQVNAVLDWMRSRGYLEADVTYEKLVLVMP